MEFVNKVKIFEGRDVKKIEHEINGYFEKHPGTPIYNISQSQSSIDNNSADYTNYPWIVVSVWYGEKIKKRQ